MKAYLSQLANDYRNASWHLKAFGVVLILFMVSASTLLGGDGHWGPALPELNLGFMSLGGGHLSDIIMMLLLVACAFLCLTDGRRNYRSNRGAVYGILFLIILLAANILDVIVNHSPIYESHALPNGGTGSTVSALIFVPIFVLVYVITAVPIQRYVERRRKVIKGIESKDIFK